MQEGPVPVTVSVDDGKGGTATDTVTIQVVAPPKKEYVFEDVHFDFDRYDIRPGDAAVLDANAAWLKQNDLLVLIEGHADERGTNTYNLALGERRAKAAMNYLVAQGVAAARLTIISYGEERPACTAHEEACWARNRRARFLVRPR
ncbi:MAG: peptidoglycan-associated lipoprotein Pal [Candidatus Rokubacteria bacterium]|nr:peptidoglycan-associated lipoprotein Pal [Candidatus Rokubacteria bacterium]